MTLLRWILLAASGVLVGAPQGPAAAPQAQPTVSIVSPPDGSYVSGPLLLRAFVDPAGTVSTVAFFADGVQVCALTRPPFECDWDAGGPVIGHQIRVVATLRAGGRIVRTVRTKDAGYTERVDVDVIQVPVVVSKDGHFVRDIPQSRFHVSEGGVPQRITSFADASVPLDLVVGVDISGSMVDAMPQLRAAVREFLTTVPEKDTVTLLGFNGDIFSLATKATTMADRLKTVDRLAAWGTTSLYDVLIKSIDLVGTHTGRKAIVIFTDGEDQGSHASLDDAVARAQETDAAIFMIGQGRGATHETLKRVMTKLATPSGGRAVFTEKIEELRGAFREILDELSNQYLLSYPPTNVSRDGSWRTIKVKVDGYSQVRARQGYKAKGK